MNGVEENKGIGMFPIISSIFLAALLCSTIAGLFIRNSNMGLKS
jgi:hypothetical protein